MLNQSRIDLDQAKPGMVVDESIRNRQGVLLLNTGAVLTEKNLIMLKSWGVHQVAVKGGPESSPQTIRDRKGLRKEIEQTMASLFEAHIDDPVMQEVRRVATRLIKRRLGMGSEA